MMNRTEPQKNNGGMMSKNKFGKSVDVANAYATYRVDNQ